VTIQKLKNDIEAWLNQLPKIHILRRNPTNRWVDFKTTHHLSSETGLGLCKVPKTNQKILCMCVNAPLYVQLWPLISWSSQVQMPHFCFHRTYTNIFYLHCKFLNSMKKNKRINFSKKNSKILWLPQKNLMALSNVPGKLSLVNQIFKSKRFNLKLSTTWPSWNF